MNGVTVTPCTRMDKVIVIRTTDTRVTATGV
jgi:hypothetical protein